MATIPRRREGRDELCLGLRRLREASEAEEEKLPTEEREPKREEEREILVVEEVGERSTVLWYVQKEDAIVESLEKGR